MLQQYNNTYVLNEYMDYLQDKGKIIKIIDTSKNINIKSSNGLVYYFLKLVSICLIILTIYWGSNMIFGLDTTYDIATNITVLIGLALLTAIVIWVTHNEKGAIKFNVTYPNENQIKINNKIFDIKKDECKIYIIKNYEYNIGRGGLIGESYGRDYYTEKYNIVIKGKHTKKSFQIAPGTEKDFKDFIYNFDFEQSETRKQNYKVIKDAFNILEEKYK